MKQKNNCIKKYLMPVIYAAYIYILWEAIGAFVSYVIGKITSGWESSLYSTYISMLLNEISTFVVIYILFHKKVRLTRKTEKRISLLSRFGIIIIPLIQICNDIITILYGQRVFSLLSEKGFYFLIICLVSCLSIGLLEEYVWRGIILNIFLSAWDEKIKGIYISVLLSSVGFGLCHYMNLLMGQDFISTTQQVISATCMGVFLASVFLNTSRLEVPVLVHGLCNFSNFLMNEILGWNYSVWKYDNILQWVLSIGYLSIGLFFIYRYGKTTIDRCNNSI